MKKIVAILSFVFISTYIFAVDISVGARGNFNMGLGTDLTGNIKELRDSMEEPPYRTLEEKRGLFGYGAGVYTQINLYDFQNVKFGIQPEIDINFNNGYYFYQKYESPYLKNYGKWTLSTNTIDIPVLATADYQLPKGFSVGLGIGPQISIPFSPKYEYLISNNGGPETDSGYDVTVDSSVNFGFAFDLNTKWNFGKVFDTVPLTAVIDFRYNLDLTATKIDMDAYTGAETEVFYRRGLNIGLGIEYNL